MPPPSRLPSKINYDPTRWLVKANSSGVYCRAKKHAEDQGGKIKHEYTLIKGFS